MRNPHFQPHFWLHPQHPEPMCKCKSARLGSPLELLCYLTKQSLSLCWCLCLCAGGSYYCTLCRLKFLRKLQDKGPGSSRQQVQQVQQVQQETGPIDRIKCSHLFGLGPMPPSLVCPCVSEQNTVCGACIAVCMPTCCIAVCMPTCCIAVCMPTRGTCVPFWSVS